MASLCIKLPAKCILAGEHAVLRGHPAIVFPITTLGLKLEYESHPNKTLQIICAKENAIIPESAVNAALTAAETYFQLNKKKDLKLLGTIRIYSTIPVKAGLGSSAALCGALGKLLHTLDYISADEVFSFCQTMENVFHGTSSGLDLAAILYEQPIVFQKNKKPEALSLVWQPQFFLFDTNTRSDTKSAVQNVAAQAASSVDEAMKIAAENTKLALQKPQSLGFVQLKNALDEAKNCFAKWGLINPTMQEKINFLLAEGASSVKPTGSGNGGFLLSLWEKAPPSHLHSKLIALY